MGHYEVLTSKVNPPHHLEEGGAEATVRAVVSGKDEALLDELLDTIKRRDLREGGEEGGGRGGGGERRRGEAGRDEAGRRKGGERGV